jgi:hypothetical protein
MTKILSKVNQNYPIYRVRGLLLNLALMGPEPGNLAVFSFVICRKNSPTCVYSSESNHNPATGNRSLGVIR